MSGKPFTRLQQYQWCRAAIDSLCLLDSLGILFEQKALVWCRARLKNLKSSMSNCDLENRTSKAGDKYYRQMKDAINELIPDSKKITLESVQPAMRFCVALAELMFMDAVNTCPTFAYTNSWRDVKEWLRECARQEGSSADEDPLPEEVAAAEMYHKLNCQILGYPKKYGW